MAVIVGTEQNDSLMGSDGADRITGLAGDDTLWGLDGRDHLDGGSGNDMLFAGEGMTGHAGNVVLGDSGNDLLYGGMGDDILEGGSGDDVIWASGVTPNRGNDRAYGGDGRDIFFVTGAAATVTGGEGQDRFVVYGGDNVIDGTGVDSDFDTLDYSNVTKHVIVNLATGTARSFQGGAVHGHDTLIDIEMVAGSWGNDRLIGGNPLNDIVEAFMGGGGSDTINGRSGFDWLVADYLGMLGCSVDLRLHQAIDTFGQSDVVRGIEAVVGTQMADVIAGNRQANQFDPMGGDDQIDGRAGYDTVSLRGLTGSGVVVDLCAGTMTGGGNATIAHVEAVYGTQMQDRLLGSRAGNLLSGGAGEDCLRGRAGGDVLMGEAGNDSLHGGCGADLFVFSPGGGQDRVCDFAAGDDRIAVVGYGFTSPSEVLSHASQVGGHTIFRFADGGELTLGHTDLSTLTMDDFIV